MWGQIKALPGPMGLCGDDLGFYCVEFLSSLDGVLERDFRVEFLIGVEVFHEVVEVGDDDFSRSEHVGDAVVFGCLLGCGSVEFEFGANDGFCFRDGIVSPVVGFTGEFAGVGKAVFHGFCFEVVTVFYAVDIFCSAVWAGDLGCRFQVVAGVAEEFIMN